MRCILVDDEPLARERFRSLLDEADADVTIVGEAGSGKKAVPLIHDTQPEVVFLDVQMPVLDGFDVVDLLAKPRPHIVFVTAYDEYALKAFEVHALDYLTKPVRLTRLNDTLQRLLSASGAGSREGLDALQEERNTQQLNRLTVHVGRKLRVISLDEVRYIEAEDKLVFAYLEDKRYRTEFTLQELEQRLDDRFVRIHRSVIVNLDEAYELIPWSSGTYRLRLEDGTELPVARRRTQTVKDVLRT